MLYLLAHITGVQKNGSGYNELLNNVSSIPHKLFLVKRTDPRTILERLAEATIRKLSYSRWYRFSSFMNEIKCLICIIKSKEKIKVLYCWGEYDIGFLPRLRRFFPRVSFYLVLHNESSELCKIFRSDRFLKDISGVILLSKNQSKYFKTFENKKIPLAVIPHGIAINKLRNFINKTISNRSLPNGLSINFLHVGSYGRDFEALDLFAKFVSERGHSVTVVAPEKINTQLKYIQNDLKLSGLTQTELINNYMKNDFLVMFCYSSVANNAILEAMCFGLPVIMVSPDFSPEYLVDDSLYFRNADFEIIYSKTIELANNHNFYKHRVDLTLQLADSLNWNRIAPKIIEFLYSN